MERYGEKEEQGSVTSVAVFGPAQLCGFTAEFLCLGRPRNRSSTPSLPLSSHLPRLPPVISPPLRSATPPTFSFPLSPSPLSTLPSFPSLSILSLNLLFLSPSMIPNILLSPHQYNVLFGSAFLLYTASKVTLSSGRCVCMCSLVTIFIGVHMQRCM